MPIKDDGRRRVPDSLRRIAAGLAEPASRHRLTPIPEDLERVAIAPEDQGVLLQDDLDAFRERATENNPLTRRADAPRITNKDRVNVIFEGVARKDDSRLATLLGTTFKAAQRWRTTGSYSGRKGLLQGMIDVYVIADHLTEFFPGDQLIDRRMAVLYRVDYDTNVSPMYLIRQGQRAKALALVEKLIRLERKKP